MYNFQVNTFYKSDGTSFDKDDVAMDAVGRDAEESGWGCGEGVGMIADIMELQQ